jgi:hypothetical protein
MPAGFASPFSRDWLQLGYKFGFEGRAARPCTHRTDHGYKDLESEPCWTRTNDPLLKSPIKDDDKTPE